MSRKYIKSFALLKSFFDHFSIDLLCVSANSRRARGP